MQIRQFERTLKKQTHTKQQQTDTNVHCTSRLQLDLALNQLSQNVLHG